MAKTHYTREQLDRAKALIGEEWPNNLSDEKLQELLANTVKCRAKNLTLSGETPDPMTGIDYDHKRQADQTLVKGLSLQRMLFEALHSGITLPTYREREAEKTAARAQLQDASLPLAERVQAAQRVIAMHYARSVWDGLDHKQPLGFLHHPGLAEYTAHYLHSSPDLARSQFGENVAQVFLDLHPTPPLLNIRKGSSYWLGSS
ncbi:hypothetical protein [Chromobacterium haemolyticum]|uniref:hypothetical protein n=1 Tax=Chromobacterium haemolyticum TaxID=394935 RepID=UPI000D30E45E|nr:hypothetical protein [Chromobacterium haemolyticum]PTU71932.1 hypothetical protein DBB33_22020 [Chromobacterium haemolyticum]